MTEEQKVRSFLKKKSASPHFPTSKDTDSYGEEEVDLEESESEELEEEESEEEESEEEEAEEEEEVEESSLPEPDFFLFRFFGTGRVLGAMEVVGGMRGSCVGAGGGLRTIGVLGRMGVPLFGAGGFRPETRLGGGPAGREGGGEGDGGTAVEGGQQKDSGALVQSSIE